MLSNFYGRRLLQRLHVDRNETPYGLDGAGRLQGQQRLCFGNLAQCNYTLNTFCADGTCRPWQTPCEPVDASDTDATTP